MPPPLAVGDVRHVGDPIALVVAESRYVAEDACELIEVDLDAEPSRSSTSPPPPPTPSSVVHGAWGLASNAMVEVPFTPMSPDLDEAFAARRARRRVHDRARTATSACRWKAAASSPPGQPGRDELDIVCSCQGVHETRNFFARYLQIPEATIRVTARDVGGGFGQKMFVFREECAVVLASQAARPAGQVDRGPAREPRRRRPLAQRARHGAPGHRRRPGDPGHHRSTTSPTSAPTRRARR